MISEKINLIAAPCCIVNFVSGLTKAVTAELDVTADLIRAPINDDVRLTCRSSLSVSARIEWRKLHVGTETFATGQTVPLVGTQYRSRYKMDAIWQTTCSNSFSSMKNKYCFLI